MEPELVLINPWIHDFAAYDLWSKPLGLLYLAAYLRDSGFKVHLIDCLDIHHPEMMKTPGFLQPTRRKYGTGKFWRQEVVKPPGLEHIPRPYSRYGISPKLFLKELQKVKNPSAILITSMMTYWYPGVKEAIALCRKAHPRVPVILGGLYAKLCEHHALRFSGADKIITQGGMQAIKVAVEMLDYSGTKKAKALTSLDDLPFPEFDLLRAIDYVCILTSMGCPYRCKYCASPLINPRFLRRDPAHIMEEVIYWHKDYKIRDFAFYDDALLVDSENHICIFLEKLVKLNLGLRFHTPNALHVKEITPDVAYLINKAGFRTIRLGLETSDPGMHRELDMKINEGEFERAVRNLQNAGFPKNEIGAYILAGLPGQSCESVLDTIEFAAKVGAMPYLAEYSPIPHTPLWENAVAQSEYDISAEPLFHNNTLLPCWPAQKRAFFPKLKQRARELRKELSIR
ncbi:MAG: radical SAM protein [Deltaproteobacteria bacterium]|nr:radical SAM protein [Deltaproteobacteria bacterium]